jgi:hypothetical protein
MLRREFLQTSAAIGTVAVAGCSSDSNEPAFAENFEDGLGDWDSAAAIGPEVELEEFEWEFGISEEEAASGDRSLRIWNEGDYDDGVTWGVHPVSIDPGSAYDVSVTAQFWSESESFNTIRNAVMRLGPEPPEGEEDFPQPSVNTTDLGESPYGGLREPLWLADGWREYSFEWTTPELATDTLYVAVGHAVVWETGATHYIDDITIEVDDR